MRKNILYILFALSFLIGQNQIDVIQLKNGDIIKGRITENKFKAYVKIELEDGSIFTFQYSKILNITTETKKQLPKNKQNYREKVNTEYKPVPIKRSSWFSGPIRGYTYKPEAKKTLLSVGYSNYQATSLFNHDGKEEHFKDIFWEDDAASPVASTTRLDISARYSLNDNISVGLRLPYLVKQKWKWNPQEQYKTWFKENQTDLIGESGIGDIGIYGMYLLDLKDKRVEFSSYYTFPSGTSPDEKPDNSWSSTGLGHSRLSFGVGSDIKLGSNNFLSGYTGYEINNKSTYNFGSGNSEIKYGNRFWYGGSFTLGFTSNFSLAFDIYGNSTGETTIDGQKNEDTNSNSITFTPIIGVQINSGNSIININCEYLNVLKGIGRYRYKGFRVGFSIS
jgi:hypothetical protein